MVLIDGVVDISNMITVQVGTPWSMYCVQMIWSISSFCYFLNHLFISWSRNSICIVTPRGYFPLLSLELYWAHRLVNLSSTWKMLTAFGPRVDFELQETIIKFFTITNQRYVWGTQEVVSVWKKSLYYSFIISGVF